MRFLLLLLLHVCSCSPALETVRTVMCARRTYETLKHIPSLASNAQHLHILYFRFVFLKVKATNTCYFGCAKVGRRHGNRSRNENNKKQKEKKRKEKKNVALVSHFVRTMLFVYFLFLRIRFFVVVLIASCSQFNFVLSLFFTFGIKLDTPSPMQMFLS